jgi:hypothetical protein
MSLYVLQLSRMRRRLRHYSLDLLLEALLGGMIGALGALIVIVWLLW